MACPDDNQLVAMLENPARFAELEVHIDSCEHCRRAVAAVATARTMAVGTPGPGGPDDVDRIGDRYEIERVLGRGGMGTVYLARDKTLGRDVALKVHGAGSGPNVEPAGLGPGGGSVRLHREALAMAKLAHPNVVTVFEIGELEDRLYVAMEYVKGGTFRDWLAHGPTWRQTIAMLLEVGAGLAAAHDAGLVHRDLKPENILVASDGRPRVSDFGLARVGASLTPVTDVEKTLDTPITVTGAVLGTPAYMAPEQLAGEIVDARSDQFAFCIVAWEALFGTRPWGGATLGELKKAIHKHDLKAPRDGKVPDRVRDVIARGLSIDAADRYPDVRALLAALRRALAPRTRGWIAASVLGTALVVGGSYAAYAQVSEQRHESACAAAGDSVRKLVSPEMRRTIQSAFAATGAPFADSSYQHAEAVLARYADVLATQTVAVCRDEHAPVVAKSCLDEQRVQLAAYVDSLAHADTQAVQRAPDIAWSMLDTTPCAHPERAPTLSHADGEALAKLRVLADQSKFREAAAGADVLVKKARAAHDQQLELAALFELAENQQQLDAFSVAPLFHQAEALAETLGRDLDAARALVALGNYEGVEHHDYSAAHADFDLAKAKLLRLGDANLALHGNVLVAEAQVLIYESRMGEAETSVRAGVVALRQALGADHPRVGVANGVLAQVLEFQGKHDESLATARDAERVLTAAYGAEHPMVAGTWIAEADALVQLKRTGEARELLQKADQVFAKIYGNDSEERAKLAMNLAEVETAENHFDAAVADYRRALAIVEHVVGPTSQEAAGMHRDIAYTLALGGKLDAAITEAQQGITMLDAMGPDAEPRLVGALTELANMQTAKGLSGIAAARRAVALAEKRPAGAEDPELAAARDALKNAH